MKRLMLICLLLLSACSDPQGATVVLAKQGYTNIQITGWDMFGCSKDDTYSTGFKAVKDGNYIEGVVCSGMFTKGSTIRFY